MPKFPFQAQIDTMDCGPACIRMIAQYYGKNLSLEYLQNICNLDRIGTSIDDLNFALNQIGFETLLVEIPFQELCNEKPLPTILYWSQKHFVVLHRITNKKVYISDPAIGLINYTHDEFLKYWNNKNDGLAILIEPTDKFFSHDTNQKPHNISFKHFFNYLIPHKRLFLQIAFSLIAASLIGLVTPFVTQSLIDIGIQHKNIKFIYLILFAQIMIFIGKSSVEIIRNWLLLHVSTRINIAIISDFLVKLMSLPISFFDSRNLGDTLQRIRDHDRIKRLLTSSSLDSIFSLTNLIIFGIVLLYYNKVIFIIYSIASIFYLGWILQFLKKRRVIDHKRFNESSAMQSNEIQLVQGMQEIKLNQAELHKKNEWEKIQIKLFKISLNSLKLEQLQEFGGSFINESKNIFITFYAAMEVVEGQMTIGMMMATMQIIGQLNGPLFQLIGFIQESQDAKISLDRLGYIHNKKDEDEGTLDNIPDQFYNKSNISIKNLSFRYGGEQSTWVLRNISLIIPSNKTTAIVGLSGSGKTTLLKLLLKFYIPQEGQIFIGKNNYRDLSSDELRKHVGAVMQEGYIFSDSILKNITISSEKPDLEKFKKACELANIKDFIDSLPMQEHTKVGNDGIGLSSGQNQRLMIARAIYKNPSFILLDEATSSLDASNEKQITDNIEQFCKNKTTVVIAHRLSTVKYAHKIIVLDKGKIVEQGTHRELLELKGKYYHLVKNQLEIG
ncbi:peptidase domain-containing ABC transporter [Saccharicrinis aurantiacus]|uniref:peptidase domain-containing ABC transporter n=1 Tax=Saccharicrinis aurantiacus TaxID=1849719 RepID=UPI000950160C|nr:peptidase domain-containing ABC transporter [Saccharicrinis aurantiacus]